MTIPQQLRRKYGLEEGAVIQFEETKGGLVIKPVPDITDSAGSLSKYADATEVLRDTIRRRSEEFR